MFAEWKRRRPRPDKRGDSLNAFRLQALMRGIWIRKTRAAIVMSRGGKKVLLSLQDVNGIPLVVHLWEDFFDSAKARHGGYKVLDFSRTALLDIVGHDSKRDRNKARDEVPDDFEAGGKLAA
jgi:hypothetical protein